MTTVADRSSPTRASRRVLLVCGSTRPGSSNLAALTAVHRLRLDGIDTDLYDGLVALPAFVPELDPPPDEVTELYDRLAAADAVLFCTPEYAGGLPGSLKNLLDWVVGGGQLYGKPVAWLDVANPGRGGGARAQLLSVLGYVGAQAVDAACIRVELERGPDGSLVPDGTLPALRSALLVLAEAGAHEPGSPDDGIRVEEFTGDRAELRGLFELAEDSEAQLDAYICEGTVLVAMRGHEIIGHLQLVETARQDQRELKNMAVRPTQQGGGVGRLLVAAAVDALRGGPTRSLVVSTAAADTGNLRFYQRQGFRLRSVEADAFTPEAGYPVTIHIDGIALRDRVWLDRPV